MNYEPNELGGAWAWFNAAHWGGDYPAELPPGTFSRLMGGNQYSAEHGWRAYRSRREALADLDQALKDANGNFR